MYSYFIPRSGWDFPFEARASQGKHEYTCRHNYLLPVSMVITYVYAKNNAPQAGRGFLNDVQNINSNCDITMWAGIYKFSYA